MAQSIDGTNFPYEYIFKYIIIGRATKSYATTYILGDMGVGKSCLLHQFTENKCTYSM